MKFVILLVCIIGVAAFSVGYHNNEVRETVKEDLNSEKITTENVAKNISEVDKKEDENTNTITNNVEEKKETENTEVNVDDSEKTLTEDDGSKDTKLEAVAGSYSNLSNKTCAWGFVRKSDGVQPEFYGPHAKVLDDNQGIYCGNKEDKVLYLTFDEGYENGYSGAILDTLKEKGVTAAFFVTMPYVKQNPDLVRRMINEGHIVGNHTVNHPSMPEVTDDNKLIREVMDLHDYIHENFNYDMKYLRPPKGEYSERTAKLCLDLGYKNVLWSSAYADWDTNNQKGSDYAKKMICDNFHNGNVMLLHAVSKDNTNVLGDIIDEARNRGYVFKTLDEFKR